MISIEGIQRTEQAHIYMIEFSLSFYVEISTDIDFFPLFFFFFFFSPETIFSHQIKNTV